MSMLNRLTVVLFAVALVSCSDESASKSNVLAELDANDRLVAGIRLAGESSYGALEQDKDDEPLEVVQDTLLTSALFSQECCNGKIEEELITCCAPAVLKYYEQVLADADWVKISELSSKDEVFIKLRYHKQTMNQFVSLEDKYLTTDEDDDWN